MSKQHLKTRLPEGILDAVSKTTGVPTTEFYFDRKSPKRGFPARQLVYVLLFFDYGWSHTRICAAIWPDRDPRVARQTVIKALASYEAPNSDYLKREREEARLLLKLN